MPRALDYVRAARFLAGTRGRRPTRTEFPLALQVAGVGDIGGTVYEPPAPRGTLVALHGLSPLGETDPRWVAVARDLAGAGFRVVAPHLPWLVALRIDPGGPDRIAQILSAVADDTRLTPSGRIGLFSICFGAGMALLAGSRSDVAPRITAIGAVGAYGSLTATLQYTLASPEADPYAMLVLLANYFEQDAGPWPEARAALDRLCRIAAVKLEGDPRAHIRDAPDDVQSALGPLLSDPAARLALAERLVPRTAVDRRHLDPRGRLDGLQAPVTLLHGRDDNVIPASESEQLAVLLAARGHPHRLVVTPLISHADRAGPVETLREGPRVLGALAAWLTECAE